MLCLKIFSFIKYYYSKYIETCGGQIGRVRRHQIMMSVLCHAKQFVFYPAGNGQPSRILIYRVMMHSVLGKLIWHSTHWRQVDQLKNYSISPRRR